MTTRIPCMLALQQAVEANGCQGARRSSAYCTTARQRHGVVQNRSLKYYLSEILPEDSNNTPGLRTEDEHGLGLLLDEHYFKTFKVLLMSRKNEYGKLLVKV